MIIYVLLIIAAILIVILIAKKIKDIIWDICHLNDGRVDIQNAIFEKLENSKKKK